jgi:hypothetical protein
MKLHYRFYNALAMLKDNDFTNGLIARNHVMTFCHKLPKFTKQADVSCFLQQFVICSLLGLWVYTNFKH